MAAPECPFPYCDDRLKHLDVHVERLDGDLRELLRREATRIAEDKETAHKLDWLIKEVSEMKTIIEQSKGAKAATEWLGKVLWAVIVAVAGWVGFKLGGQAP